MIGVFSLVTFQVLIAADGNYCFIFNLLTVALCLLAVDDAVWPRLGRKIRPVPELHGRGVVFVDPRPGRRNGLGVQRALLWNALFPGAEMAAGASCPLTVISS